MSLLSSENMLLFSFALIVIAFLYSSVGHGGASGYLALMTIFAFPVAIMKPSALLLNLFVSSISFFFYYRMNYFKPKLFYKINQKPGKPMFFGSKNDTLVFALPGNPASSLTNFYIYVCPAIKNRMGFSDIHLKKMLRKLNDNLTNTTGKTLFLKALYDETHVTVLDGQSSAMLNTFAIANSLLVVPNDVDSLKKGQLVTILPID